MAEFEPIAEKSVINKPLIGIALAVAIAGGSWVVWHRQRAAAPPPPAAVPVPTLPQAAAEPAIEHPVSVAAGTPTDPLPQLADSDGALNGALGAALGRAPLSFLAPDALVRHVVVTVDNLPRQKVAVDQRPVHATPGAFLVEGDELHATLDPQNYERYRPLIEVLRQADMRRLADVYLRFYPLFQAAYQDLGYPNGYFNDRLVTVIDLLLATPAIAGDIELVRPNVLYEFADPALESRPAGQKLLIRMGLDNAAVVKAQLTALRAAITAAPQR